jgi:hypothetical protein
MGARLFTGAALGGTASLLSGGSFANGAITGVLLVLFNHVAHEMQSTEGLGQTLNDKNKETLKENIMKAIYAHHKTMEKGAVMDENGQPYKMRPIDIGEGLPEGLIKETISLRFGDTDVIVTVEFTVSNNQNGSTINYFGLSKSFAKVNRINLINSGNSGCGQFGYMKMHNKSDYQFIRNVLYGDEPTNSSKPWKIYLD